MLHILWLFILPFIASLIVLFLPIKGKGLKGVEFALSLNPLIMLVIGNYSWIGETIQHPWLPALSIEFYLKVDELSLIFLFLTAIIIPFSLLAANGESLTYPNVFYCLVLVLQGLLIGFFTARDLALFTLFWEAMLIPLYFLINLWGGPLRQRASLRFLIYMIGGSSLMVAAVLSLYFASASTIGEGTFNLDLLNKIAEAAPYAVAVGAIFVLAFAVKTPLFPFHAWLPDTYYQASTSGTILLAAILSKAGVYGFLRIGLGLFPNFMQQWSPFLLGLSIVGVLYGALAAWMQKDYKRLIAYSSFSHVNFILVGIFVWNQMAHSGAILQSINHGITITALFLAAHWLEERLGSTSIAHASGLAKYLPTLCWITLFFVLSSVGLPGLNNFVGEFLIFLGLFAFSPWLTAVLGLSIILSVIYMLRWMQKMYFGVPNLPTSSLQDIGWREISIAVPLILLIVWLGIYPAPVLNQIRSIAQEEIIP